MTSAPEVPTLDRAVLEHLQESLDDPDGDFILSLAQVFEGQAAELMTEISSAADEGDLTRLRQTAHSLKGSSATLGGTRLAGICQELEHWEGPASNVPSKVAELRAELTGFQSELRGFLTR
ncbi:MAG: Hpt domain-containing protein [Actinobacteria bacterium]|nr:Hpt domain-containing protein [Actinomycetota bacterium]